jgi:predicted RNA-binding Zn ribbon-like protein
MDDRDTATGATGLVQAFVNTVDLQDGPEELTDPNTLGAWLVAKGLMAPGEPVREADLKHAIALREAMRGLIWASSGGRVYPVDVATLNEAAAASGLRARFGADGRARLEPDAKGVEAGLGRLVATLFTAMATPEWARLKVCARHECRWVFYDSSRNHSSRWCKMASCGNREKARRFRTRRHDSTRANAPA